MPKNDVRLTIPYSIAGSCSSKREGVSKTGKKDVQQFSGALGKGPGRFQNPSRALTSSRSLRTVSTLCELSHLGICAEEGPVGAERQAGRFEEEEADRSQLVLAALGVCQHKKL